MRQTTQYLIIKVNTPDGTLPKEADLKDAINDSLTTLSQKATVTNVVKVKKQALTLNIGLQDACEAVIQSGSENDNV